MSKNLFFSFSIIRAVLLYLHRKKKKKKKKSRGKANAVWLYTRNVFLPCSSRSSLRENGAIISQLFKSLLFSVSSHKSHTKTESQSLFVLLFQQKFYSQTSAFTFFSKLQLRKNWFLTTSMLIKALEMAGTDIFQKIIRSKSKMINEAHQSGAPFQTNQKNKIQTKIEKIK